MPPRDDNGRARVARPDLYQPIYTDGAPGTARGLIGDAQHVTRVWLWCPEPRRHPVHRIERDAHDTIPITHR